MAITYQLYISSVTKKLEYEGLNNVIIKTSFGVSAQTSAEEPASFSYSCSGYKEFSVDGIDPETFINFDEVTAETVVGWLLQSEGVESVEEFSYVKAAVNHINVKLAEVQVQVEAPLIGESSVFGSVDYTPPVTPEPEPEPEPTPEELV